jgi:hypothetical protein
MAEMTKEGETQLVVFVLANEEQIDLDKLSRAGRQLTSG